MKPFFIGLTGGSGSGKTAFINALVREFGEQNICVVSQDHYYFPIEQQKLDENGVVNFDEPETIDRLTFEKDMRRLKSGERVERLEYTFNNENKNPELIIFAPAPVVVLEGLFVLYYEELQDLIDLRLFIDTPSHLALKRRIFRDQIERGYDLEDVLYRFEYHVMPAYEKYLRPSKETADLVIPNRSHFNNALRVIQGFLHYQLDKK